MRVATSSPAPQPAAIEAEALRLRDALRDAASLEALARSARLIPGLAVRSLDEASGAGSQATTTLISALNDEATIRAVHLVAAEQGMDLAQACWLAFGSQARGEQTIATDQDNGLVFDLRAGADVEPVRQRWLAFGQRVNDALAACGYPLCSGRVMAGQPLCCLTVGEWCARIEHWMAHGSGNDLLAARIYFDLRPLAGRLELAQPLVDLLTSPAAAVPRFAKQLADIVLCNHVPLNWLGRVVTQQRHERAMFDLKMSGTALFVDAARLWALAHSIPAVGTVARLRAAAAALRVPASELQSWIDGFNALQRLRLEAQRGQAAEGDPEERCWVAWERLDGPQRTELKRALHAARWVQQRIALDYRR